jgi:hypothetical protein
LSEQRSELLETLGRFGFVAAFGTRAATIRVEYDRRLAGATKHIDVMGFGLKTLWEDYRGHFAEWKQRAHVRILLIDPNSPFAAQRDREEDELSGSIRRSVKRFLRETAGIRNETAGNPFEVRLYTCLPSVNIFRVDDEMFWGPYFVHEQSRNAPTFIVRRGGELYGCLAKHFDAIWEDHNLSRAPSPADAVMGDDEGLD